MSEAFVFVVENQINAGTFLEQGGYLTKTSKLYTFMNTSRAYAFGSASKYRGIFVVENQINAGIF